MKSSAAFLVNIPQPCRQSWEEMTPSENGKHCDSCQKKVIDFSMLTDREVVNIFSGSSQKICGRFNAAQLNRILDTPVERKNVLPAVVLTTLLVISGLPESAASPVVVPFVHAPFAQPVVLRDISMQPPRDTERIITGQLIDSISKEVLPGATIKIKGTSCSTFTDTAGNFRLRVPDHLRKDETTLVFAYIGFIQKELLVTDPQPLKIEMSAQVLGEMDMVVICKAPVRKKVKSKWKRLWGNKR